MDEELSTYLRSWVKAVPDRADKRFLYVVDECDIPDEEYTRALALSAPLAVHHFKTARHNLRVGTLAGRIALALSEDARNACLGGAIHDIGKVCVPERILNATTLTEADWRAITPHPEIGYDMAIEVLPEAAECMKYHHQFQPNPYPGILPVSIYHRYEMTERKRHERVGRLIALADFVDALRTRHNDKFGGKRLKQEEKYARLRETQIDIKKELEQLIDQKVIGF